MPFEMAAAIPQAAVLAWQGLRQGKVSKGQDVLINGAGGGVGTFALQMAKAIGAVVTAVDSREKLDMLKSLGADEVIDYAQEDFTTSTKRYDLILDVIGNRSIFRYKHALSKTGTFVIIGGSVGTLLQTAILGSWLSHKNGKRLGILAHKPNKDDLELIKAMHQEGKLKPVIEKTYPLSQLPEALALYGTGNVQGKVVITV